MLAIIFMLVAAATVYVVSVANVMLSIKLRKEISHDRKRYVVARSGADLD